MTAFAPIATLTAPCTLLDTDNLTIETQKLLLDGQTTNDNIVLHLRSFATGRVCFVTVPATHLLALDLDDASITHLRTVYEGECYALQFTNYQTALDYLAKHYGLAQATDRAPSPTDASPCSSVIIVPAHLSTPPRLTRRPLSTTTFSPFGVMHMSKKQPIRVFLDPETHSRHLIQAGTNGLTSSALSERLIEYGLAQLESGDKAPLEALSRAASPAPNANEA